jgi:simple sugar transport system permease protein
MTEILRGNVVTTILAVVLALIVGGVLIAVTNPEVQAASGYFFARPGDTLSAAWTAVAGAYAALFTGSVINPNAPTSERDPPAREHPRLCDTAHRGGSGHRRRLPGGTVQHRCPRSDAHRVRAAALVTFQLDLPAIIQVPLTLVVGIIGGALWGGSWVCSRRAPARTR